MGAKEIKKWAAGSAFGKPVDAIGKAQVIGFAQGRAHDERVSQGRGGPLSSAEAAEASSRAKVLGNRAQTSADHTEAAIAHDNAASLHYKAASDAAKVGKAALAKTHAAAAEAHERAFEEHDSNAKELHAKEKVGGDDIARDEQGRFASK